MHVARPRERPLSSRAAQAAVRPVLALLEKKHCVGARVPLRLATLRPVLAYRCAGRDAGATTLRLTPPARRSRAAAPRSAGSDQRAWTRAPSCSATTAITELLRDAIDEDLTDNGNSPNPISRGRGEKTMALAADMNGDLDPALVLGTPVFDERDRRADQHEADDRALRRGPSPRPHPCRQQRARRSTAVSSSTAIATWPAVSPGFRAGSSSGGSTDQRRPSPRPLP